MTTPTFDRTPYCHKIRYGITGAPTLTEDDMDGSHAPGVGVTPTLIELVYSPARDGKAARIDASVTGDWTRFGEPDGFGGQVTTHFKSGPDGWPAWLAEEARLHDPAAEIDRLRARVAELEAGLNDLAALVSQWHSRAKKAEARVADLEGPAVEAKRNEAQVMRRCAEFVRDTYDGEWVDDAAATLERDADITERGCLGYEDAGWGDTVAERRLANCKHCGRPRTACLAASVPSVAPLGASPVSGVSESAQSPMGAPTGALTASGSEAARIALTRSDLAALLAHHADVIAARWRAVAPGAGAWEVAASLALTSHANELSAEMERPAVAELLDNIWTFPLERPVPTTKNPAPDDEFTAPPRRTLTPNEYSAAWHAVEGSAGEEGADPGTVLHAVLDRLGIDTPAAQPTA